MRLFLLVVTLNVCPMSLDEVCHVAGLFPMDSQDIPSLLFGFSLVVVEEEAFGFGLLVDHVFVVGQ